MLSLKQIQWHYPENLRDRKRFILREYLQYQILRLVFDSKLASQLSFLGGTALRMVYGNQRWSEDLDFDCFDLNQDQFGQIVDLVAKGLRDQGYEVEMRQVLKGAFRCYIRLPRLLYDEGLSGHKQEKILIQLDAMAQGFTYEPDRKLLDKFDVFTEILVTPADILLSQKIYAIFNRRTPKGRDIFDASFLWSRTTPNYDYLKLKLNIENPQELKKRLTQRLAQMDLKALAKDVEPFLFVPGEVRRVELFQGLVQKAFQ